MLGTPRLRHSCLALSLLTVTSCMVRKAPSSSRLLDTALPQNFDFLAECGLTRQDAENPEFEIFSANYKSLPLRISGSSTGVGFRVTTTANIAIQSTLSKTIQNIAISVNEAIPTSNSFLAKMAASKIKQSADEGALTSSGTVTTTQIPLADWIHMNRNTVGALNAAICGSLGTSEIQISKPKQNVVIRFSPPIILGPNPRASLSRLKTEFTQELSFRVDATTSGNSREIVKGTQSGWQTIRSIDPIIEVDGERIEADAAWEILFAFPKGAYSVGLPSRQAYYLDAKSKTFSLIVTQSDQVDPTVGSPLPPAYLMHQGLNQ